MGKRYYWVEEDDNATGAFVGILSIINLFKK